ncbi:actin cytoskeleton-regulatory complex protein PAN1-like [Impatiens glandulifera]|uniref:actin cytoskeleton-regulatory complex protein PAN1-like n=1 Tax=Impatiens glandulifera TaxID=253017 RepID=UPI001FB0F643|nr:actin cytoskeleton-regulatory complex protein PAN1-like [Impatiens glandulifera]
MDTQLSEERIKAYLEELFCDTIAPWQLSSTDQRIATLEERDAQTESSIQAVLVQLGELIAAKMAADEAQIKQNEIAALKVQEDENERQRVLKEREQADANLARQVDEAENADPKLTEQKNKKAARLIQQTLIEEEINERPKTSSTPVVPTTRAEMKKRKQAEKAAAKKVQLLMDNCAEPTGVLPIDLEYSDSDEIEENVQPLQKRTRIPPINVIPLRTVPPSPIPQRTPVSQETPAPPTRPSPVTNYSGTQASSSRPGFDPCNPGKGIMSEYLRELMNNKENKKRE